MTLSCSPQSMPALIIITALNTTIDTITVDDAIAAAERRSTANQTLVPLWQAEPIFPALCLLMPLSI